MSVGPPAPRPCSSCPYRQDTPSGIWDAAQYDLLRAYDAPTGSQPPKVFLCHQNEPASARSLLCAGWVGCHDVDELLAFRIAGLTGLISADTYQAAVDYVSPVPLFASGTEAAEHGLAELLTPSDDAINAITKIIRRRSDIRTDQTADPAATNLAERHRARRD